MSKILVNIDGREVEAPAGMTVLEAAKQAGVAIPTLCNHEKLEPYGGCRLCTVEAEIRGRSKLVASCLYPVEKDLIVKTRTAQVDKIRKVFIGAAAGTCSGFRGPADPGRRVWCRQRPFSERILILYPLRSLCKILCRDQKEGSCWLC